MNKIYLLLFLFCVGSFSVSKAQRSIKLNKQQTTFFYSQLNLHGGYLSDINGKRWDVTNRGPNNQIAFQLLRKNQKTLQRGYVKLISPVAYSLRFSIPFNKTVNQSGQRTADFQLKLLDTWVKFNTKWDRTSIWIGNKSIPFGHNPKLDPVSSFMTNLIKMDIGFVQDLGIFLKTPVNKRFDLELSLTSGGLLNKPIVVCDNIINDIEQDARPKFSIVDYSYKNTWLLTSRLGSQSFNKNEFGMIAVSGRIANNLVTNDLVTINRIGVDWIHKYLEKLKIGNQITLGITESQAEKTFATLNYQGNVDYYIIGRIILSSSLAFNYHNSIHNDLYHFNFTNANSITYTVSPHTRFRINHYLTQIKEADETQWGILLQYVTGFGKRN